MIKAAEEDSRTPDDIVETMSSTTAAITTSTATPIDTLIRVAMRRKFLTRNAIGITPDDRTRRGETAEMRSDRIGEIISLAADIFTPSDEGERERSRQRSSRPTDGPHSVVDYSSWPAPPKRGMSCGPHDTGQGTSLTSDHQPVGYPAPPSGGRLPGGASGRSPGRRPPQPSP